VITDCWHSKGKTMIKSYKQLSLEERRKIETWRAAKVSVDVIAD
jgi:IS30 family transposase